MGISQLNSYSLEYWDGKSVEFQGDNWLNDIISRKA